MRPEHDDSAVADIVLEQYLLRELPADVQARLETRLRSDPSLQQRLDALARSDEEVRSSGWLDHLAPRIASERDGRSERSLGGDTRWRWWRASAIAAVGLAGLAIVVARTTQSPGVPRAGVFPDAGHVDRIKGLRPALILFRRIDDGSETLADGAVAHSGDLVRVGYRAAGRPYGVILSIDGRGEVTRHLPAAGDRAAPLGHAPTVLLDAAYELDDAPKWERFYFVTAERSFDVGPIIAAAQRIARTDSVVVSPLPLPSGFEQSTFSLQKEVRP